MRDSIEMFAVKDCNAQHTTAPMIKNVLTDYPKQFLEVRDIMLLARAYAPRVSTTVSPCIWRQGTAPKRTADAAH